ncbi:hypothetical protein GLOIN_2v1841751 [Rhizophagus clarus]|uniref:Uncharacterized protein n=1 Tax=Rhizophagus clarus TaxID=94130 RepID=A0A8H3L478_9GLOM|nr:hypothetical protein GLOIN_2v1841751 [Rhizophagus clarus]
MLACLKFGIMETKFQQKPQKPQIKNPYYFQVKNWSPEEVNQFLKERMGDNWTIKAKEFFEEHKITGSELFILNKLNKLNTYLFRLVLDDKFLYNLNKIIDQLYTKTIYIKDYSSDKFFQTDIHNDKEFFNILHYTKGKGFVSINNNDEIPELIVSLKNLQHNQYYIIDCYTQKELNNFIQLIPKSQNNKSDLFQIKEFKYWSSEEVNKFLKEKLDNRWTIEVEQYFEKKKFTGNQLLKLNLDDINYRIYRYLPIIADIKFEEIVQQLQGNYNNFL